MRHAFAQPHAQRTDTPDLRALPADALINRQQLSALSGFAPVTLKIWAAKGRGPRITRIEGLPRYRAEDVRLWLEGRR